jgi:hypothetical protein
MSEMYDNVRRLRLPAQALSLLGARQTFVLLFLSRNSVGMQERFSLTLYRSLYNEFFSLSCAQGEFLGAVNAMIFFRRFSSTFGEKLCAFLS